MILELEEWEIINSIAMVDDRLANLDHLYPLLIIMVYYWIHILQVIYMYSICFFNNNNKKKHLYIFIHRIKTDDFYFLFLII